MDVSFDNAQELNMFHDKAAKLFKSIDGLQLSRQTIQVEKTHEIVPLLYLRNSAQFSSYKYILLNHIQTMLNFHLSRYSDDVLNTDPSYPNCLFKGTKLGVDFNEFIDERQCDTLTQLQQQLPIKAIIRFPKPNSPFWRSFSQSLLWQYFLKIRLAVDDCGGSVIHGRCSIVPYHIRTLDFKTFQIDPPGLTLLQALKDKLDYAPPSFWESNN